MLTIIEGGPAAREDQLRAMRARAASANQTIETAVREIMEAVKVECFTAVERYTQQFDHTAPY